MKLRFGFNVALAVLAVGCSDSSGEAATGGVGGMAGVGGATGRAHGMGGVGGFGGGAEPGGYGFACTLDGLPIPLAFTVEITEAEVDPPFVADAPSALTTKLDYLIAPRVYDLTTGLEQDEISEIDAVVVVRGATPGEIAHTAVGLPLRQSQLTSDVVTIEGVTPDPASTSVELEVAVFRILITGLPEAFYPGGLLELVSGEGGCEAIMPVDGSGPIVFPVGEGPERRTP